MTQLTSAAQPRFVFAGDRQLAVDVLTFLLGQGAKPLGLILPEAAAGSHSERLLELLPNLPADRVWRGKSFRENAGLLALRSLELDYILSIHFSLIYPPEVLSLPRHGVLNLHPAYLPYNRGWHNSLWAMIEQTPYGATLHFMSEELDAGDIVHQRLLEVRPEDTGDSLYQRALALEYQVFMEAWPSLRTFSYQRNKQVNAGATSHFKKDLERSGIRRIELAEAVMAGDFLNRLRALTTNRVEEAAFYEVNGRKYRVQVKITPEPGTEN